MDQCDDGKFVLWTEYERLKAEVDALKLGSLLTAVDVLQFIKLKEENERLTEIIRREVDGGVDLREEAQRTVEENHGLRAEVAQLTSERDGLWESNEGNLKEVSRLKAEVERLTQNTDKLCKHGDLEIARLKAEVESLKQAWVDKKMQQDRDTLLQQVERLRKAGDAMAETFVDCLVSQRLFPSDSPSLKRWIEAKKGNANE